MLGNKNYEIIKMHICSFERKNGILTFNMEKYPERLCVFDKSKKVVIDVETGHQYPYIRVLNGQMFYDVEDVKKLTPDIRVGCMEYATFIYDLETELLDKGKNIIGMLENGNNFPDGNKILTNEEYLEMVKSSKDNEKVIKFERKGK